MRAERCCAAVDDVTAADADGGKTGEQDGDNPCPAVLDPDDAMPDNTNGALRIHPKGRSDLFQLWFSGSISQ